MWSMAYHGDEFPHVEQSNPVHYLSFGGGEGCGAELSLLQVENMIRRKTVNKLEDIVPAPDAQKSLVVGSRWHTTASSKGFAATAR